MSLHAWLVDPTIWLVALRSPLFLACGVPVLLVFVLSIAKATFVGLNSHWCTSQPGLTRIASKELHWDGHKFPHCFSLKHQPGHGQPLPCVCWSISFLVQSKKHFFQTFPGIQLSNFLISVPQPAMTRPNGKKHLRHFKGPTEVAWKGLAKVRWGMVERPAGWIGTTGRLNLLLLIGRWMSIMYNIYIHYKQYVCVYK